MKSLALLTATLALGLSLAAGDADAAKRFGGGKSSGMQRQEMSQPHAPNATPASPAQAPSATMAPRSNQQAGMPAAAQTPQKRSWMGPIAGLAAGIGLAALASHFGFGEELASMMTMALIAFAVIALIGFFMRRRAPQQPTLASAGGMRFDGAAQPHDARPASPPNSSVGGASRRSGVPSDFDADGFVRNAKVNFIRLQAANDARNLEDIREYTTPELFAEIKMNWMEHGNAAQKTDVVSLNAEVIDVTEEAARYIVSVRFTGLLREDANAAPEGIDEIWHMTKPRDGKTGWVVAGIQQNS